MTRKVNLDLNKDVILEFMKCERRENIRGRQKKSEASTIRSHRKDNVYTK